MVPVTQIERAVHSAVHVTAIQRIGGGRDTAREIGYRDDRPDHRMSLEVVAQHTKVVGTDMVAVRRMGMPAKPLRLIIQIVVSVPGDMLAVPPICIHTLPPLSAPSPPVPPGDKKVNPVAAAYLATPNSVMNIKMSCTMVAHSSMPAARHQPARNVTEAARPSQAVR